MRRSVPIVIVGDLIGSREIVDRRRAAGRIRRAISRAGAIVERAAGSDRVFLARPALTRGIDELSAVLREVGPAYRMCRDLNLEIAPERFRFAIVRGAIDVGLRTGEAARMDGPGFHWAAEGISRARAADEVYSFRLGGSDALDRLVTALANTLQVLYDDLSDHQRRVIAAYERAGTQAAAAKLLDITQQAVSDALRASRYRHLERGQNVIDSFLQFAQTNIGV